jgi:hypothetical protein
MDDCLSLLEGVEWLRASALFSNASFPLLEGVRWLRARALFINASPEGCATIGNCHSFGKGTRHHGIFPFSADKTTQPIAASLATRFDRSRTQSALSATKSIILLTIPYCFGRPHTNLYESSRFGG